MDQRKCALLVDHTGTLHAEWKHGDCLNQLGELWTANIIISCCVCVCARAHAHYQENKKFTLHDFLLHITVL